MKKVVLATGLLTAIALPSFAEGTYVFGDLGQAKYSGDFSESDTSFSVGAGYKFNSTYAVELGYADMGGVGESGVYQGYSYKASVDVSAIQLSGLAYLPFSDKFSAYGRLGLANVKAEATAVVSDGEISESATESDSNTKAVYGLGLAYAASEKVGLRAEYTKYNDVEVSTLNIGVTVQF